MVAQQNFRSAFHGFNREDVVHYIEYMNNQHNAQVNQLKTELQALQAELEQFRAAPTAEDVQALQEKCAQLEEELAQAKAQMEQAAEETPELIQSREAELKAYRRAERVERVAQARVNQLYAQASTALSGAVSKVSEASLQMEALTDLLEGAAADLETVRPTEEND